MPETGLDYLICAEYARQRRERKKVPVNDAWVRAVGSDGYPTFCSHTPQPVRKRMLLFSRALTVRDRYVIVSFPLSLAPIRERKVVVTLPLFNPPLSKLSERNMYCTALSRSEAERGVKCKVRRTAKTSLSPANDTNQRSGPQSGFHQDI